MAKERTLSSKRIYEGQIVSLRVDKIQMADGRESTREVVEHDTAVAIVAIDSEDNALLVKQFRYPLEKELLEIPAGGVDGDESPEEAVVREMQEETGYLPRKVEKIGGFYSSPGFCTEYLYLFLATDLTSNQLYAEDTESITLVRTPVKDIPGLITSGSICDAKSIAGLLTYLEYRKHAE
ncbi:NUDIX hydrolase [Chloroflexota bacterium]